MKEKILCRKIKIIIKRKIFKKMQQTSEHRLYYPNDIICNGIILLCSLPLFTFSLEIYTSYPYKTTIISKEIKTKKNKLAQLNPKKPRVSYKSPTFVAKNKTQNNKRKIQKTD